MIAAGKDDIRKWFQQGVIDGYQYMLVVYDRMKYPDNSDSPYYYHTEEEAQEALSDFAGDELSEVMEAYDLSLDMDDQLAEKRAWHLPGYESDEEAAADRYFAMAQMMLDGTWPLYTEEEKNPERMRADAAYYYGEAMKLGHTHAALFLGLLHALGSGVEKDYKKAFKLFEIAAADGHTRAYEMLCLFYWRGHGVTCDFLQSARWALKGAEDKEYCLSMAQGLRKSPERLQDNLFAYVCLKVAEEAGKTWAAKLINKMFEENGAPFSREETDALLKRAAE